MEAGVAPGPPPEISKKGMMMISTKGLTNAQVLAALYNEAKPKGLGFLHYELTPMTVEEAEVILSGFQEEEPYLDYVNGRVIKTTLTKGGFDEWMFDRDYGKGAAARALESARKALTALGPPEDNEVQDAPTMGLDTCPPGQHGQ